MPNTDIATIAASINQRLGQIQAAQTAAEGAITAATVSAVVAAIAAVLSFVGVFLTARVARRNGFIQTRATQQLKHADFRQTWINALREEMARFLALTAELITDAKKEPAVIQSMAMILLRMNSRDKEYGGLIDALDEVLDAAKAMPGGKSYGVAAGDYLIICQRILKSEWETTRDAMLEEPPEWGSIRPAQTAPSALPIRMPKHLDVKPATSITASTHQPPPPAAERP